MFRDNGSPAELNITTGTIVAGRDSHRLERSALERHTEFNTKVAKPK